MLEGIKRRLAENQILSAALVILAGWLLYRIRDILILLFIALILAIALRPAVDWLHENGIPLGLAAAIPLLIILLLLILILFYAVPQLAAQINRFAENAPGYINQFSHLVGFNLNHNQINQFVTDHIGNLGQAIYRVTTTLITSILALLTISIVSYYLLVDYGRFRHRLVAQAARRNQSLVMQAIRRIETKIGHWLRGQAVLSLSIGVLDYLAYVFIGLPFAFILALLAALLEVVPGIGPTLAAVPALLIALSISSGKALAVLIAYVVIQLMESYLLTPKIMSKAIGLHPLAVLLGLMVGGKLGGLFGALLSLPIILIGQIVIDTLLEMKPKSA